LVYEKQNFWKIITFWNPTKYFLLQAIIDVPVTLASKNDKQLVKKFLKFIATPLPLGFGKSLQCNHFEMTFQDNKLQYTLPIFAL
jgi:hypothetical protein